MGGVPKNWVKCTRDRPTTADIQAEVKILKTFVWACVKMFVCMGVYVCMCVCVCVQCECVYRFVCTCVCVWLCVYV